MTEQERGLIFLCSLLGPIPFVWFITAKFVYGINSETAHYLVPYLLKTRSTCGRYGWRLLQGQL